MPRARRGAVVSAFPESHDRVNHKLGVRFREADPSSDLTSGGRCAGGDGSAASEIARRDASGAPTLRLERSMSSRTRSDSVGVRFLREKSFCEGGGVEIRGYDERRERD